MEKTLFITLFCILQLYSASEQSPVMQEKSMNSRDLQDEYQTEKLLSFRKHGLSSFSKSKTIDYSLITKLCLHFQVVPSRLIKLDLSWNFIENINEGAFEGLSGLEELSLITNKLTQIKVDAFKGLKSLRILDLWYNKLTEIDPSVFKDLSALETLNIGFNHQLTQNNIQAIKKALPGVKVLHHVTH
jgi:Leucine-rich repeat (LRR) protein